MTGILGIENRLFSSTSLIHKIDSYSCVITILYGEVRIFTRIIVQVDSDCPQDLYLNFALTND